VCWQSSAPEAGARGAKDRLVIPKRIPKTKVLVGSGRFERPTPCAQGRFGRLAGIPCFLLLRFQADAATLLRPVERFGIWRLWAATVLSTLGTRHPFSYCGADGLNIFTIRPPEQVVTLSEHRASRKENTIRCFRAGCRCLRPAGGGADAANDTGGSLGDQAAAGNFKVIVSGRQITPGTRLPSRTIPACGSSISHCLQTLFRNVSLPFKSAPMES
jgi:hypothetical protein